MKKDKIYLAASILAADPLNLEAAIKDCERTGLVDWIQVDVMDGHFTPNLSFGPAAVKAIHEKSSLFIDVHLMIQKPYVLLNAFAKSGADLLTVHAEAETPLACVKKIKSLGCRAGLAIKPKTPVSKLIPYLKLLDLVLIMTVEPGFAGQAFLPSCLDKIRQAKRLARGTPVRFLEVDGGVNAQTIPPAVRSGANVLVCGNSLFKDKPSVSVPQLREAIARGGK